LAFSPLVPGARGENADADGARQRAAKAARRSMMEKCSVFGIAVPC
jgi:hypothetical protein